VLLVVVAIFTYSELYLTGFVVAFYTVAFGSIVITKSDLMRDHRLAQACGPEILRSARSN
jgi:hypothetical protein